MDDVRNLIHCAHEAVNSDEENCDALQTCLNYARRRLEQAQVAVTLIRQGS